MGVVLRAHCVRGESHIQRSATRVVATIHIQFQDISNERKSEAWSHFLHNKAQQTPKYNLYSIIQKEGFQALKI